MSTAELFFASVEAGCDGAIVGCTTGKSLLRTRIPCSCHSKSIEGNGCHFVWYTNPSQEIYSSNFQAQPELAHIGTYWLMRPTGSSASVSSTAMAAAHSGDRMHCISALADSPQVPDAVRSLAMEALTWLKE